MPPLKKELKKRLKGVERVAILGIGSPLRGDDALGLVLIKELRKGFRKVEKITPLKLFSCGTTPENYTGEIKRFNPTHIIIVDAADMGKEAGTIDIIDTEKGSVNISFSTHSLPMKMYIDYLSHYLDCHIICIGIQPETVELGSPLSSKASKAVKRVSDLIIKNFQRASVRVASCRSPL